MSSQILRHLKNDFDILFLQEIYDAPILPHVYATVRAPKPPLFRTSARTNTPEASTGPFWFAPPGLARFVTPLLRLDTEGLLAAAVLTLPGAPPTLLVSV